MIVSRFFNPLGFAETSLHKLRERYGKPYKNRFTWPNQRDWFFPVIKVCLRPILPLRIWNSSRTWPSYVTEGSLWTLRKFVLTSGSCICMVRWAKIWRLFSAPVVVVFVLFNTKDDYNLFSVFFWITIIRVILFILLNYWNLTIFLATGKSGEFFRGTYFFKAKSLYSATVVSFFSRFD